MVPEKRDALYERSDEFATHRITSGAAYPSDRDGGYITASLAINQMMKNPEFRADFDAVKTEVRKGLGMN
jgi:acid phosphatase (class A)